MISLPENKKEGEWVYLLFLLLVVVLLGLGVALSILGGSAWIGIAMAGFTVYFSWEMIKAHEGFVLADNRFCVPLNLPMASEELWQLDPGRAAFLEADIILAQKDQFTR